MSLMGGVGMMSAGLIGTPGLGYFKDRFAAEELRKADTALFEEWKNPGAPSEFLFFNKAVAIDPARLEAAKTAPAATRTPAQATVVAADIQGNRNTLKVDSFIPAAMAVAYLLLLLYFKAIGGYRPLGVDEKA